MKLRKTPVTMPPVDSPTARDGKRGTKPPLFNRRILLQSAAVSGGAAMLVTIKAPEPAWATAETGQTDDPSTDALCHYGLNVQAATNFLQGFSTGGTTLFTIDPLDAHLARTVSQETLVGATPSNTQESTGVVITKIGAYTGQTATCQGSALPVPRGNSYIFSLAINPSGDQAAVLHQPAWVPQMSTVDKTAGGRSIKVDVGAWAGSRYLETFDLTSMRSLGLVELDSNVDYAPIGSIGYAADNTIFVFSRERSSGEEPTTSFTCRALVDGKLSAESSLPETVAVGSIYEGLPYSILSSTVIAQQTSNLTLDYLNIFTGQVETELPLLATLDRSVSAKGLPSRILSAGEGRIVYVRAGRGADLIDLASQTVLASVEISADVATRDGTPTLRQLFAAVDTVNERLLVADARPNQGGIWVYDLANLVLVDRWLSSTRVEGLYCGLMSGTLFATALGTSLTLALDTNGNVQSTFERSGYTTTLI
jgi:hypothetical protein